MVKSKYPSGGNGQIRAPGAHQSSQGGPVPAAVVGNSLILARQVGEGALHGLGDGEAGVVDDVAQVSAGQQVLPFVDFVDGKQHGLGPAEGAEVKPGGRWESDDRKIFTLLVRKQACLLSFITSTHSGTAGEDIICDFQIYFMAGRYAQTILIY